MPCIALAGGDGRTLLAECPGALLQLFDTRQACELRLVCREFQAAVAAYPWEDRDTVILGSIAAWRACFPRARCANVCMMPRQGGVVRRMPVVDADFVHFAGLWELNISRCWAVTDAAFVHLRGIRVLNMSWCRAVTDAAFVHLRGIRVLDMGGCNQPTITDAALAQLVGIQMLMFSCVTITDAAFIHLRGIRVLNVCSSRQLTDAAFAHLQGIHTLFMDGCNTPAITDAAFAHLRGIHSLGMEGCRQAIITRAGLAHLVGITNLGMYACSEEAIAAAEDLGLPVARRSFTEYGSFHRSFVEVGEEEAQYLYN